MFDISLWRDKNENSGFFLEFNGPACLTTESYIFLKSSIRTNDCNYLIILAAGLKIITWYHILPKKYKLAVRWIDTLEPIFYGIVSTLSAPPA